VHSFVKFDRKKRFGFWPCEVLYNWQVWFCYLRFFELNQSFNVLYYIYIYIYLRYWCYRLRIWPRNMETMSGSGKQKKHLETAIRILRTHVGSSETKTGCVLCACVFSKSFVQVWIPVVSVIIYSCQQDLVSLSSISTKGVTEPPAKGRKQKERGKIRKVWREVVWITGRELDVVVLFPRIGQFWTSSNVYQKPFWDTDIDINMT